MWMIVDNTDRSLAMAGAATSDYASGPFTFVRSFYPDGNKTRDQTLHQEDDDKAANSSKEASKIYRSEPVDYLDTNGALSKFEGELENGADLSFIVNRAKYSIHLDGSLEKKSIALSLPKLTIHPSSL
jgi:hypothetical protein